jgi:hypothetical protein
MASDVIERPHSGAEAVRGGGRVGGGVSEGGGWTEQSFGAGWQQARYPEKALDYYSECTERLVGGRAATLSSMRGRRK